MKKIIFGIILAIFPFVFFGLVMRLALHQNDTKSDYIPSLSLCIDYFENYSNNSNVLDSFTTNIEGLKSTISNGYNFGDFTKSVYYVITSFVGIILIPFDFISFYGIFY